MENQHLSYGHIVLMVTRIHSKASCCFVVDRTYPKAC
jgi:hypothetical protein